MGLIKFGVWVRFANFVENMTTKPKSFLEKTGRLVRDEVLLIHLNPKTLLGEELTFLLKWESSSLGLMHVRSHEHSAFQDVWDVLTSSYSSLVDLTESVTETGTGTNLRHGRRISAIHLKNVWDALIHRVASLIPASTCVCSSDDYSSSGHTAEMSTRSEWISRCKGGCSGGVISTELSIVISTLLKCVFHTQTGHLEHEPSFYPFLSEQGIKF